MISATDNTRMYTTELMRYIPGTIHVHVVFLPSYGAPCK